MKDIKIITVRLPEKMYEWLRKIAYEERVSMNSLIVKILGKELEANSKVK